MQVVLWSPVLGTLDLTSRASNSGRSFDLMLTDFDMGTLQPTLTTIDAMFGAIQSATAYQDRTFSFIVGSSAASEADRVAGGEVIDKWLKSGDCELRYVPTDVDARTSCLLILSGYVSHVAASTGSDKFMSEWNGNPFRWYQVSLTTAPQVLSVEPVAANFSGDSTASDVVTIDGSFAAAATITAASTTGLGETVIYTCPALGDYDPALFQYLSNIDDLPNVDLEQPMFRQSPRAGTWFALSGAKFTIPVSKLPKGNYALVARACNDGPDAVSAIPTVVVKAIAGGVTINSTVLGSTSFDIPGTEPVPLIPDGSFDAGIDFWMKPAGLGGHPEPLWSTAEAHSGTHSMAFNYAVTFPIPVVPGHEYQLNAWSKYPSPTLLSHVVVWTSDSSGSATVSLDRLDITPTGAWEDHSFTMTAPPTAVSAVIHLLVSSYSDMAFVDDVSFVDLDAPEVIGSLPLIPLGGITLDHGNISPEVEADIEIAITGTMPDVYFDEIFAFRLDDGATLTMIDAGSGDEALGVSHTLVAAKASPRPGDIPTVTRGLASDVTQQIGPGVGLHQFDAPMLPVGDNLVYVATTSGETVDTSISYRSAHETYVPGGES